MVLRCALLALSVLVAAASSASAAPAKLAPAKAAPVKTVAKPAPAKKPVRRAAKAEVLPGPDLSGLVYASLPGFRPLTLDLYLPPHAPQNAPRNASVDFPKPLLVFVHGGGWNSGDARHGGGFQDFPGILTSLAAKGYVVAGVNYRLSGEARFPGALQDVKAAVRWLRAHAGDYAIDTTRVAVWGEEAGGQIAALVGSSCGVATLEPDDGVSNNIPSDCVQAVIDWHGISDLAGLTQGDAGVPAAGKTPEGDYLGCEPSQCAPGVVRGASPLAYIGPNTPPFLIQHGAHKTVPLAQSQKLYDALQAAHVPAELVTYADGDPDVAQKTIAKLLDFLDKTFPKKPLDKKPPPITSKALPY